MDRCALFVDAGYALADGAMAVHGTRRRDSVSWDHAGLLKLLAGLARDRTGLPVLRCYWYETADGGRTAEHDALAEMPGLKLRLLNARPGRREGIDSQLRRDIVTLAKSGAIADAFIASADEHLAEIVAEVQDLGLRVVVLHIASDGGWTIPQPLRQECDDIVEISGVHLRPFVDLIRGAEPAPPEEQRAAVSYGSGPLAHDDVLMSAATNRAGAPAQALPAPVGAYQASAKSDFGAAQPYANGGQVHASQAAYDPAGAASVSAAADQALMAARGAETGGGSGQFVDLQRSGTGGQVNGAGAGPGSWADGVPQAGDEAGYEHAGYEHAGYEQAGYQQAGSYARSAGTGLGGSESYAAQGAGASPYAGAEQGLGAPQFPGAAHEAAVQQHAGGPQYAAQPQHAAPDRGAAQHALPGQGLHAAHGSGSQQQVAHGGGPQRPAHALGGSVQASDAGGSMNDGAAGSASGQNQGSAAQPASTASLTGTGTGYPDAAAAGMHAQSGSYQNGIVKPAPGQAGMPQAGTPQNGLAPNGPAQSRPAQNGFAQNGTDSGYQSAQGASGPGQTSSVHHLSGLSFPPGSAASAQNGYPASQSGNGSTGGNGFQGGYQNGSGQGASGVHATPGYQNGSAQNAPGQYPSFNGFQAGGIQNGSAVNPGVVNGGSASQAAKSGPASGNGADGRGSMNPAGFEAAPVSAHPSHYGPIDPGYFGGQTGPAGQAGPGGQAAGQSSSGQHSMPGSHAAPSSNPAPGSHAAQSGDQPANGYAQVMLPPAGPSFQPRPPHQTQPHQTQPHQAQPHQAQPHQAQPHQAQSYSSQPQLQVLPPQAHPSSGLPAVRVAQPLAISLPEAVKAAHSEGFTFGESVGRDAPGLWLEAVLARKPRMPSDLEARLLQGSVLPIDSLLHDEVRHSLRRGFWDALESARR